jgi:adenine-specific DNA-methyltransferase
MLGVCAVCIDERELFRLGMLMDEVFGERNRIAIINWQKSYSAKSDSEHVSTATEYVIVYAKDRDKATTLLLDRTEAMDARYGRPDGDLDEWRSDNLSAKAHPKPEDYGIQSPFTGDIHYPTGSGRWRKRKSDIKRHLEGWGSEYVAMSDPASTLPSLVLKGTILKNGRLVTTDAVLQEAREKAKCVWEHQVWPQIYFGLSGEGRPAAKRYLKDVKKGRVPMTYWADEEYDVPLVLNAQSWRHAESGHSQAGINELSAVVGPKHAFETVKPLKLFSKIIQIWCPPSGIVLDPFAGSGTTGHAVLSMNEETGTSRNFILIEQSRSARNDNYARTLLADRLRRVITGEWMAGQQKPVQGGFTFKTSTQRIDRAAVLAMQREEMADLVLMSHWDVQTRKGPLLTALLHKGYKYLVAKDIAQNGYFLVWDGPDTRTALNIPILTEIAKEAEKEGLSAPYHVYARTSNVHSPNLLFYKIPEEILNKIGFNDAFGVGEEE